MDAFCLLAAAAPLDLNLDGIAHRHEALVGAGDRRDADLGVDIENGGAAAALGPRLDADAGEHVVVVLVGRDNVLLEDDLLAGVARKGVAGAAGTGLAGGERGVALEAGLDDGEPGREISTKLTGRKKRGKNSLETLLELEVDADAAILAGIGGDVAGANRGVVLVKGDVEDGASGVERHVGVASGAAGADGIDANDLDVLGSRGSGHRNGG